MMDAPRAGEMQDLDLGGPAEICRVAPLSSYRGRTYVAQFCIEVTAACVQMIEYKDLAQCLDIKDLDPDCPCEEILGSAGTR